MVLEVGQDVEGHHPPVAGEASGELDDHDADYGLEGLAGHGCAAGLLYK